MREKLLEFKVDKEIVLSEFLKEQLSKKFYRRLKYLEAKIFVNNIPYERYLKVKENDIIKIIYEEKSKEEKWPLYNKPLNIYYEDKYYLVCYKEPNLLTIPTKACPISLYQQLIAYLGEDSHISFLNRLDRETAGLVLVAKDTYSANLLNPVKTNVKRKYLALVEGELLGSGTINKKIKRSEDSNNRIIADDGKEAITHYEVMWHNKNKSLVRLELETGRTHQIRVHLASIGHPIIGDGLYGQKAEIMCLESYYLGFKSFYDNIYHEFKSEGVIWQKQEN